MASDKKHQDQALRQAFQELAQEDVQALRAALDEDPALRQQADALYRENRQQLTQRLDKRLRRRSKPILRYAALAISLLLIALGITRFMQPPRDSVSLTQPSGSVGSGGVDTQLTPVPFTPAPPSAETSPTYGDPGETPTPEPTAAQTQSPWTEAPISPSPWLSFVTLAPGASPPPLPTRQPINPGAIDPAQTLPPG